MPAFNAWFQKRIQPAFSRSANQPIVHIDECVCGYDRVSVRTDYWVVDGIVYAVSTRQCCSGWHFPRPSDSAAVLEVWLEKHGRNVKFVQEDTALAILRAFGWQRPGGENDLNAEAMLCSIEPAYMSPFKNRYGRGRYYVSSDVLNMIDQTHKCSVCKRTLDLEWCYNNGNRPMRIEKSYFSAVVCSIEDDATCFDDAIERQLAAKARMESAMAAAIKQNKRGVPAMELAKLEDHIEQLSSRIDGSGLEQYLDDLLTRIEL